MSVQTFRYESWAVSDTGRVRTLNEDRYLADPAIGMWLVADGVGGHDAGEVASGEIVDHLATLGVASSAADQHARFVDRLTRANAAIRDYAERNGASLGSTVVAMLAFEGQYRVLWMGDSRVYLVRKGALTQLSRDHSEVQELVDRGILSKEEARSWPRRNVITRAVGASPDIDVEVAYGTLEVGDTYILCSDGLTTHASDADILEAANGRKARDICERLLELTLSRGGTDNVTIVVVQCRAADTTVPVDAADLQPAE
jgi:protein phosphatase